MKKGVFDRLRNDTDRMWKGGMGLMLILLLLCIGVMQMVGRMGGLSDGMRLCTGLLILYGAISMGLFGGLYFMTALQVNGTLYRLGDLIESLTEKEPETVFPVGEDTILSRLQTQLMRLYDILRSYEERERKMSRQLDENIGDFVHQINTPVTNIGLYAGFLRRDDLTAKEREHFLDCMEEQAQKLSWLGESFSKISRLETGIIRLWPKRQSLQPMILRAVGQIMEKAQLKGMEIVMKGEVQAEVLADERWTAEAFFNVLDNAVKYGDRDSIIEIEAMKLTNYTAVVIRNHGERIGEEEYHDLFKRFYRGKRSGAAEGSGLGLYIVRKILEGEKGYVTVGCAHDGRTQFALYLRQDV